MKKSLKILALLVATHSSALAISSDYYTKINLTANSFTKKNKKLPLVVGTSKSSSFSQEKFGGGFGIGMKINDNIYSDITWTMHGKIKKNTEYEVKRTEIFNQIAFVLRDEIGTLSLKSTSLSSLMLGAYLDVFKFDKASVFLGAKAGAAFISEEYKSIIGIVGNRVEAKLTKKNFTNPAAGILIGVNCQIHDNISVDTTVGYNHYGKGKAELDKTNKVKGSRINYDMAYGEIGLKFHF